MNNSNKNHVATETTHPFHDVNIPLMAIGQPAVNGIFAQHAHSMTPRRERYKVWWLLLDLASIAWVVPIAFALYVNFNGWIIGAGMGCRNLRPNPSCFGGIFHPDRHKRLAELNEEDRAMQAYLQLASKALETWFGLIASSIVFSVTMRLATSPDGLPLGYLFTHVGFPDLLGLADRTLWTSWGGANRHRALRLWCFILLVFVLCIASNLMGPATAILIIPQLGWPQIQMPATQRFDQISASQSPRTANMAPECDAAELALGNFSCTGAYSSSLDEISSGSKLRVELYMRGWVYLPTVTEHDGVLFTFNVTKTNDTTILWAPSRKALRGITDDYMEVVISQGILPPEEVTRLLGNMKRSPNPDLYDRYNNTLSITLHRTAPSLGFDAPCFRVSKSVEYFVSETQSVRCVTLAYPENKYAVVCSRTGPGWSDEPEVRSQFSIADTDTAQSSNISVDVRAITKTAVFNNTDTPCRDGAPCDWESIFALGRGDHLDWGLWIDPRSQQFVQYTSSHPSSRHTIACYTRTQLSFPDYVVNVIPDQNPIGLAQVVVTDSTTANNPTTFHPDWLLAAWSLPSPSSPVSATRPAAINLVSALKSIGPPPAHTTDNDTARLLFQAQHDALTFHALTFVGYSTTPVAPGEVDDDPLHPFLRVSQTLRVYMYESKTRTFRAAAIVCVFGCAVALARPVVSCAVATRRPSVLRLVGAAVQCRSLAEVDGVEKERDLGRVRVRVVASPEDAEGVVLRVLGEIGPSGSSGGV